MTKECVPLLAGHFIWVPQAQVTSAGMSVFLPAIFGHTGAVNFQWGWIGQIAPRLRLMGLLTSADAICPSSHDRETRCGGPADAVAAM